MTGIEALTAAEYHSDPCEQPSLSSSIAHLLCVASPAHAFAAHPRLNPNFVRVEEEKFDVGTSAHSLLLEGDAGVQVVDAADWRTNAAKEQRDEARAAGRIPLLTKQHDEVQAMVAALRTQRELVDADPPLFKDGKPEQTLTWADSGVHCRARVDWLHDDFRAIDDYKTTGRSANPEQWARTTMFSIGADIQVAFYLRGLQLLTGATDVAWRFVVQETSPPYALSVVSLGPDVLTLAQKKVDYAIAVWRRCLESGSWPAYPRRVAYAELPPWEEARWLEKELREEVAA